MVGLGFVLVGAAQATLGARACRPLLNFRTGTSLRRAPPCLMHSNLASIPLAGLAVAFLFLVPSVHGPDTGMNSGAQANGSAATPDQLTLSTWASCAVCHATPDARVEHDARWIGLNEATTCLTGEASKPANRRRLITFLQSGTAPVSTLVRTGDAGEIAAVPATHGVVQVPAASGSAFLRKKRPADSDSPKAAGPNETLRLFWDATDKGSTLVIPSGSYELVGYCFYRAGEEGARWTASATVQDGTRPDSLDVTHSAPVNLPITPTVFHDLDATATGPKLAIKFQMRNEAGDRMTLTRDGNLVEPSWVIYDESGSDQLASGRFVPS